MDRAELCNSLIIWMNTFSLPSHADVPEEFTDGVLMMYALNQIAPTFFDEVWMSKMKKDAGTNWRLRVSNLKKILKGILDFYSEVLSQQIHDFHKPDVQAIGEHEDSGELGRLLQLILGCAVNCEEKQEYIQRIMGMEESVQHSVMKAIQELMTKEVATGGTDADSELQNQLKKTQEDMNKIVGEKEELAQRCHVLDQQIAALQDEKANLEIENDKMNERLNQHDSLEDPSTPVGRRYQMLQNQVEQFQMELERSEVTRIDYKSKLDQQDRELHELKMKNEELLELAEEARAVKDEMEILRYTSDKVAKYESTIESYKKKLEELSDLKGQIKILDEKNTFYMEKNMELEEELKKSGTFKSQLEMYKSQFKELQNKCTEESDRATKARLDYEKLNKQLQTVQREKERLVEERDSLKDAIDNLEGSKAQEGLLGARGEASEMSGSSGMLDLMSLPQDVKEKFIRLQHENKMLRLKQEENDGESNQLLQTMLEDANERKAELESQVRTLRERILEQDAQIEDLNAAELVRQDSNTEDSNSSSSAGDLRRKLQEVTERAADANAELQKLRSAAEEREAAQTTMQQRNTALQDELRRKDDDMRVMEEKYKRYLEKARSVSSDDVPIAALKKEHGAGDEMMTNKPKTVVVATGKGELQGEDLQGKVDKLQQQLQAQDKELKTLRALELELTRLRAKEEELNRIRSSGNVTMKEEGTVESKSPRQNIMERSIQVGNEQMNEHILKAKIEGLQTEVREYRREIKECHAKYVDDMLIKFPASSSFISPTPTVNDGGRFQSPAKPLNTPTKAFSEKFKLFENRCKSLNEESVDDNQEDMSGGFSKRPRAIFRSKSATKRQSLNVELDFEEPVHKANDLKEKTLRDDDKGELSVLRGRVQTLEQDLFIACQQVRVVESDLMNREHEIRAMESKHRQQMDRAMYFNNPSKTDSEKENQILHQRIVALELQIKEMSTEQDKDKKTVVKVEEELAHAKQIEQLEQKLSESKEFADELAASLKKCQEDAKYKENYYKHILDKLRKEMRKNSNPTSQMFGWFLKRDSW